MIEGAGKTRHRLIPVAPVRKGMHGAGTTGSAGLPGLPCATAYDLYALSSVHRACWPPCRDNALARIALDTSIGVSGPRDFAVRAGRTRQLPPARPPHPASTLLTMRSAPRR